MGSDNISQREHKGSSGETPPPEGCVSLCETEACCDLHQGLSGGGLRQSWILDDSEKARLIDLFINMDVNHEAKKRHQGQLQGFCSEQVNKCSCHWDQDVWELSASGHASGVLHGETDPLQGYLPAAQQKIWWAGRLQSHLECRGRKTLTITYAV